MASFRPAAPLAASMVLALWLAPSWCSADSTTRVQGSWTESTPGNTNLFKFSCVGTPTCTGIFSYTVTFGPPTCPSPLSVSFDGSLVMTGLDLTQPGALQGTAQLSRDAVFAVSPAACSLTGYQPHTRTYTGTWNGSTGGAFLLYAYGLPSSGSFTASVSAPPVFPMTVTASVTPTTTSASASVQPRAQDVGTTGSIYVFAHAPSNIVGGAMSAKRVPVSGAGGSASAEDAVVCVLAQINPNGQLVPVSASTMQAYLTGVLQAQGQAVQLLNNVSTPGVAGATVYVGYGPSAAAMLASGLFETAISIPGEVQCAASLSSAPAPKTPGPLTGLWWNQNESGWGIHFTQRSGVIVATWYTYDSNGNPKWYIAPNCMGVTGTSGGCSGTVYEVNGPHFFATNFQPITPDEISPAGALSVQFADANNASMTFQVAGVARFVEIQRQFFPVAPTAPPAVDYTDLWWNPAESGWGMAVTQQYGNIFLAWYVYGNGGNPTWYVVPSCTVSGSSCSGELFRTTGPVFGTSFNPSQVQVFSSGSAIMSFIDANNAVLSFIVDGLSVSKTLTRQIFP